MLVTLMPQVSALDDAAVNYVLSSTADEPKNGESFEIGKSVYVTVAAEDIIGTESPLIYGFNGVLGYDPLVLEYKGVKTERMFKTMAVKADTVDGKVSFSFLCEASDTDLIGVKVDSEFDIAVFEFAAVANGKSKMTLSDLIITNKDATPRLISSTEAATVTVGTGEALFDKASLENAIGLAEDDLAAAIVDPLHRLYYPAFSVSRAVYDAFSDAIDAAKDVLAGDATDKQIGTAVRELNRAQAIFEASKVYGQKLDSGNDGPSVPSQPDKPDDPVKPDQPGGDGTSSLIEVTAIAGEHGKIAPEYEKQLVREGTSASVKAIPDEGYEVESVKINGVTYAGTDIVTVPEVTNKTVIEFSFRKLPRFADVARDAWYFESVEAIAEMGLFNGTSETEFSPDGSMTRAMLVTVLYRLDGQNKVEASHSFTDVKDGEWYSDAVAWASANGIVNGYSAELFGTNDSITRQDTVTILYRYLLYKGKAPSGAADLTKYTDSTEVSDYAKPAMMWACGVGIINGTSETTLSPTSNSTRAQVATMILRFTEKIG